MKNRTIYNSFDILCKVVIEKLKKNYEIGAVECFSSFSSLIEKGKQMKIDNPIKYDKVFSSQDLKAYYSDKCDMLYEFAKSEHCLHFMRNMKKYIVTL